MRVGGLLLALLATGCIQPVDRGQGVVSGQGRPSIVSLNPCTDAILAEVAAPGQLLAISHYSKDPRASSMAATLAARYRATGGSVEEVVALDPDVVVASDFIAPATRAAFASFGIRVVTFGIAHDVPESMAQVRALAALTGERDRGEALVARVETALASAAPTGPRRIEAALWQAGGIVPGESELVADLMRRTGFASYAARRGMAQADYLPLEQVLADPPDLLLVAGGETGQRHPALGQVPRMASAGFDPRLTYCGGPTIVAAAGRLAALRERFE